MKKLFIYIGLAYNRNVQHIIWQRDTTLIVVKGKQPKVYVVYCMVKMN